MSNTPPRRNQDQDGGSSSQASSVNSWDGLPEKLQKERTRERLDTGGSTRGAFYTEDSRLLTHTQNEFPTKTEKLKKKRHRKKRTPPPETVSVGAKQDLAMGDVAALAFAANDHLESPFLPDLGTKRVQALSRAKTVAFEKQTETITRAKTDSIVHNKRQHKSALSHRRVYSGGDDYDVENPKLQTIQDNSPEQVQQEKKTSPKLAFGTQQEKGLLDSFDDLPLRDDLNYTPSPKQVPRKKIVQEDIPLETLETLETVNENSERSTSAPGLYEAQSGLYGAALMGLDEKALPDVSRGESMFYSDASFSVPTHLLDPTVLEEGPSTYFMKEQSNRYARNQHLRLDSSADDIVRRGLPVRDVDGSSSNSVLAGQNLVQSKSEEETGQETMVAPPPPARDQSQDEAIAMFSSFALADYGAVTDQNGQGTEPKSTEKSKSMAKTDQAPYQNGWDNETSSSYSEDDDEPIPTYLERVWHFLDPNEFLTWDVQYDDNGFPYFEDDGGCNVFGRWTFAGLIRHFVYNPLYPEFTSLQQFNWALILGVAMGVYTAAWKKLIETGVDFVWQTIPETLLRWGFFTGLSGNFPLPHYMWITPALFGGVLSYIFVILPTPIPGQNEWIQALHTRGVQNHETFGTLFVLSTLGMTSGLSLGPELPLVLTAGMIGSYVGVKTNQSILQARMMNLTCAAGAVGGFFGFPMAGAMFVLEIPHRMGLQYFEALSPATISSIVAVLTNRLVTGDDVTGYYDYPFLTATLPSKIFTSAMVFGLIGCALGTGYAEAVMYLKHAVHEWFHASDHSEHDEDHEVEVKRDPTVHNGDETIPLVSKPKTDVVRQPRGLFEKISGFSKNLLSCGISHEPSRAAVAGTIAGALVGVTCMFVPHVMFWGEAQLQTLIDKGRTPLPVFENEATKNMIAYGYCLIDPESEAEIHAGFSIGCAALISSAKIFVTGLSLGTGIIGGHFWGPLFVGCAASHLVTDLAKLCQSTLGFGGGLAAYPCVTILCMMGSTHVVTFRAHLAIMLILTLTISAFDPENEDGGISTAGDYSAVFPLLVVSVFLSLMMSRDTIFYAAQTSRFDIMARPEVLCEPGKAGTPMIQDHGLDSSSGGTEDEDSPSEEHAVSGFTQSSSEGDKFRRVQSDDTPHEIESDFDAMNQMFLRQVSQSNETETRNLPEQKTDASSLFDNAVNPSDEQLPILSAPTVGSVSKPEAEQNPSTTGTTGLDVFLNSDRLDELLSAPLETKPIKPGHRRTASAPVVDPMARGDRKSIPPYEARARSHSRTNSVSSIGSAGASGNRRRSDSEERLVKVSSFGEVPNSGASLLDQARSRAATHHRVPSLPRSRRHSRSFSAASAGDIFASLHSSLPSEDVESSFMSKSGKKPTLWSDSG